MTMNACTTFSSCDMEVKSETQKKYCFVCLCDNDERKIQNHTFIYGPLKDLLQVSNLIFLIH